MHPINKKYFGNRNIGANGYQNGAGDDGIGGEGVAAISWSTPGSFLGNSNVAPIIVPGLPAPTIPGGVQATWTMQFEVATVSTGAGNTNLAIGDVFAWDPSGNNPTPGMLAKVTSLNDGSGNAVFSLTVAGASRGGSIAYEALPQDSQTVTLNKQSGTGTANTFVVDVFFRVKVSTVQILNKGSGYVGNETFEFTKPGTSSGTLPAGNLIITTDTGTGVGIPQGNANNQENAIIIHANTTGNGTKVGDIIKQVNGIAYKVKTADGTKQKCVLVANANPAEGEAYITAEDFEGNTYFVTKLTGHVATLVYKEQNIGHNWVFANGSRAKWVLSGADADTVLIENA